MTPVLMNHPVTCLGYRIDADGDSVFFTGDHEPPYNIYSPGDDDYETFREAVRSRQEHLDRALAGVNLLITDSMYTDEEYPQHQGWGHGSIGQCLAWAARLRVDTLCLTHHDPCRHDDELDTFGEWLRETKDERPFEVVIAREGLQIEVSGSGGGCDGV